MFSLVSSYIILYIDVSYIILYIAVSYIILCIAICYIILCSARSYDYLNLENEHSLYYMFILLSQYF